MPISSDSYHARYLGASVRVFLVCCSGLDSQVPLDLQTSRGSGGSCCQADPAVRKQLAIYLGRARSGQKTATQGFATHPDRLMSSHFPALLSFWSAAPWLQVELRVSAQWRAIATGVPSDSSVCAWGLWCCPRQAVVTCRMPSREKVQCWPVPMQDMLRRCWCKSAREVQYLRSAHVSQTYPLNFTRARTHAPIRFSLEHHMKPHASSLEGLAQQAIPRAGNGTSLLATLGSEGAIPSHHCF